MCTHVRSSILTQNTTQPRNKRKNKQTEHGNVFISKAKLALGPIKIWPIYFAWVMDESTYLLRVSEIK